VTYNPSSIPAPGSGSSVLTLAVSSSAAAGTYTINVIGTGFGGLTETAIVTLTVTTSGGTNLVQNGNFQSGAFSPWVASGPILPTITSSETYSSSYSALLGRPTEPEVDGNSAIYQTIKIPSTAKTATLTFWYYPGTDDTIEYAYQECQIQNGAGTAEANVLKVASNTKTWTQVTYNLSSYIGKTIRLYFAVHGNGYSDYVYMYLDDISITTT
jgi:hypothetical protein